MEGADASMKPRAFSEREDWKSASIELIQGNRDELLCLGEGDAGKLARIPDLPTSALGEEELTWKSSLNLKNSRRFD